jgi:hypothetical protein
MQLGQSMLTFQPPRGLTQLCFQQRNRFLRFPFRD